MVCYSEALLVKTGLVDVPQVLWTACWGIHLVQVAQCAECSAGGGLSSGTGGHGLALALCRVARGAVVPARWPDMQRHSRSPWLRRSQHRLWGCKSAGSPLFTVPPWRHQDKLWFCCCTLIKLKNQRPETLLWEACGQVARENLSVWMRVAFVGSQTGPLPGHWSCLFGPSIKVSGGGSVAARVAAEWSGRGAP